MAGRWSISIWKPTRTTAPSSFLITAGGQLEFEKAINLKPFPIAFGFKVRGGVTVDFQAAVRYAEQLGLEWNDETACAVNDYLTALLYLRDDRKYPIQLLMRRLLVLMDYKDASTAQLLKDFRSISSRTTKAAATIM